jgi:membrane associated rhomboid family serine protease
MGPWFEEKLNKKDLRNYAVKRLRRNSFGQLSRKFSITTWIIIVNIAVFILVSLLFGIFGYEKVLYWVALQPKAFFSGVVWKVLTSMFMHGNFTHLFVNMVSLFFLGSFVEKLIGRKRFFWLYIISGLIAGLTFVILAYFFGSTALGAKIFGSPEISAVGASGAIFALGGLLAVLTPKMRVYIFFVIPMQMWAAMVVLLFVLWAVSIGAGLPFGNTAHFGGLLVGLIYGFYLKNKYKRKTALIAKYFSG